MTTFTTFYQPTSAPFQFNPTLDGTIYTATVPWSLYGQRYYLTITGLDGTLIVSLPLIGSPLTYDINLVAGYFTTSTLIWREDNNQFEVSP